MCHNVIHYLNFDISLIHGHLDKICNFNNPITIVMYVTYCCHIHDMIFLKLWVTVVTTYFVHKGLDKH